MFFFNFFSRWPSSAPNRSGIPTQKYHKENKMKRGFGREVVVLVNYLLEGNSSGNTGKEKNKCKV